MPSAPVRVRMREHNEAFVSVKRELTWGSARRVEPGRRVRVVGSPGGASSGAATPSVGACRAAVELEQFAASCGWRYVAPVVGTCSLGT
jgi:hypothetical protein